MTATIFPTPAPMLLPIQGAAETFPVRRIFCVGRNYQAHAAEMGSVVDKASQRPFYFMKDASAVVLSGESIDYPPQTADFHHEMELVVAIGKNGFEVSADEAASMIYGYACGLDMTRRDVQAQAKERRHPWDLGKNFEQSAVLSPITPHAAPLTGGLIELRRNGETVQHADLSHMIWNVCELIADLSTYYHLQAGDLLFTGTPEGVGAVARGDLLQGSIAGVGKIEVRVR